MGVKGWGVLHLLLLTMLPGCSSTNLPPTPTLDNRLPACHITCKQGFPMFERQHKCAGSRFMEDITLIGEYIVRNVDGALNTNNWIVCAKWAVVDGKLSCLTTEDVPKIEVELGSCRNYIDKEILLRPAEQRGQFPGEDKYGNPNNPPDH